MTTNLHAFFLHGLDCLLARRWNCKDFSSTLAVAGREDRGVNLSKNTSLLQGVCQISADQQATYFFGHGREAAGHFGCGCLLGAPLHKSVRHPVDWILILKTIQYSSEYQTFKCPVFKWHFGVYAPKPFENHRYQNVIWIPDHLQTGQLSTIRKLDLSGIQMVTILKTIQTI